MLRLGGGPYRSEISFRGQRCSQELIDDFRNLRPLNWRNNLSKGNDYPEYTADIKSDDGGESNVFRSSKRTVNKGRQKELRELYAQYLQL